MNTSIPKIVGIASIIVGLIMAIASLVAWGTVTSQLADENITVPSDASCAAGQKVSGPITAFCQAEIIKHHALAGADGLSYAQLGDKIKEATAAKDQAAVDKWTKARTSAMNGSFLRSSLFTSVLAYGVSLLALGTGLFLAAIGWALLQLAKAFGHRDDVRPAVVKDTTVVKDPKVVHTDTVKTTTTTTGTTGTTGATSAH